MDAGELGRQVVARRKELGLSQEELAERAGVSRNYISIIERGDARNVSMNILNRLATVLGTSPSALLGQPDQAQMLIPAALREVALSEDLSYDTVDRLVRIPRRGQEPKTAEEWRALYLAIRRFLEGGA